MLTPQEVSNRAFPKAMVGGYNMAMVDEFLDELTDDYTALYKENAALKAKLKVLVDKVEEYRATEESMRAALLTAQKMANTIVEDAEKQKAEMLEEAEKQARIKIGNLQNELLAQQKRLSEGQKSLSDFVETSRELCRKQLEFLEQLPAMEVETPVAPAQTEEKQPTSAVDEIEEKILSSFDKDLFAPVKAEPAQQAEQTEPAAPAQAEKPAPQEEPAPQAAQQPASGTEEDEDDDPFFAKTRTINLKDLKFGRNYTGEE